MRLRGTCHDRASDYPMIAVTPAEALDTALLAAHAEGATDQLVALYAEAADRAAAEGAAEAAAFFRTHAYVFALETGHPLADVLHRALVAAGREDL